jgi:hypothetical protein
LLISKRFALNHSQAEFDFVDVDTNRDMRLFVDPHFLATRSDPWSVEASRTIRSFFSYFLGLLNDGQTDEAEHLFDHLHEPNETCLGFSSKQPRGNGVGNKDAYRIFKSLSESKAAKTGLLEDLEDCSVFVRGIDKDKTSDMTTNIIRGHLIEYTQNQCNLWGIPLISGSPSGFFWNSGSRSWENSYCANLFVGKKRILLIPKAIVSYSKEHTPKRYHQHFVLNFLQHEHLRIRSTLVRSTYNRKGERRDFVTKKDLITKGGAAFDKDFLASFTKAHPTVFATFKEVIKKTGGSIPLEDLTSNLDAICDHLVARLVAIQPGRDQATDYHRTVVGILDLLFYPRLMNPIVEREIHDGRKRIDITFDNAASDGFFENLHKISKIPCPFIFAECKNYGRDVANPEVDQLAGRFSPNRGQFGLMVCRAFENENLFRARCRDTFRDSRGLIIAITDADLISGLQKRTSGEENPLDNLLSERYRNVALS